MKKTLFFFLVFIIFSLHLSAQTETSNAIGLRFGDNDGFSTEISYQHHISEINRLEFGLALKDERDYSGYKLTGLYQWLKPLEANFTWYYGLGGGVGSYSYDIPHDEDEDDSFIFIAGNLGIEHDFSDLPLLISLDVRPEIGFGRDIHDNDDLDFDIALSIRYQF